ncbi:hypothetical protein [Streptomyces boncukensis]|uniref:Uncharacterized protein n=1 Tax=Streptomyces boncukensis TaxID=2711219 RepID=A0A6G4WSC2_9ACTN|nr:hypothetical protein [Streptomyces boncukensis]NGO68008.1 hypothetical protein [Streptomyces boncukensis]
MSALDDARHAAAAFLATTSGSELPEWRPTFLGISSDGPNAIGPVCIDEDHIASEDPTAFDCCPDPIVEVDPSLVDYLVELLNADRRAAGGERP